MLYCGRPSCFGEKVENMIKFIFRLLAELAMVLVGAVVIRHGLANNSDVVVILGVALLIIGSSLLSYRFWYSMLKR